MSNGLSRRAQMWRWTRAEHAIRQASLAVEEIGADPLLTEAVDLLGKAKDRVGEYIDAHPEAEDANKP